MANTNVRRPLSEAELLTGCRDGGHRATHKQVGEALSVHHTHTVIATAWSRFQQQDTPVRPHGGGRERATSADGTCFLIIQAHRNHDATAS